MKSLFLLLLCCAPALLFGQGRKNKEAAIDTTWYEGAIVKNDGTKVKGRVRYNEPLGLVNFRDEYDEQTSYPATRIAGFEYFDTSRNKWRNLVSIENFNEQRNTMALDFHELILESENFSVWSKTEPLFMKKEQRFSPGVPTSPGGPPSMPSMTTTESLNRSEIIYLMDPRTERFHLLLRLESSERTTKRLPDDPATDKRGDINMSVIEQILGTAKLKQLQRYAKDNDLSWRKKNDVLQILAQADKL